MSLEHLYYLSQTIAAAAVLASLIYLALQTRQAARNQRAQIHDSRALWIVGVIQKSTDPVLHEILVAGARADPSLSKERAGQFASYALSYFIVWEEMFRQRRDGMIDDSRWRSSEIFLKQYLRGPGWRAAGRQFLPICDAGFSALLERLMAEARSDKTPVTGSVDSWRALASEERAAIS
jgi:hypothetical protein